MNALEQMEETQLLEISERQALNVMAEANLENVEQFEYAVVEAGLNQAKEINNIGLKDLLHEGLYCRTLFIPKGAFLTGKVHKRPYIDIMAYGDITLKSLLKDEVEETKRVKGLNLYPGRAGRKRLGYAHEDTLWITVDPCTTMDKSLAEDDIAVWNVTEYHQMLLENK